MKRSVKGDPKKDEQCIIEMLSAGKWIADPMAINLGTVALMVVDKVAGDLKAMAQKYLPVRLDQGQRKSVPNKRANQKRKAARK